MNQTQHVSGPSRLMTSWRKFRRPVPFLKTVMNDKLMFAVFAKMPSSQRKQRPLGHRRKGKTYGNSELALIQPKETWMASKFEMKEVKLNTIRGTPFSGQVNKGF